MAGSSKRRKGAVVKIKLESTGETGHCYFTKKNARKKPEKLSLRKYDPVLRRHVEYRERKIK